MIRIVKFKRGTRFDKQYLEELLEEVREIRASERMVYQKIKDIYFSSTWYLCKSYLETHRRRQFGVVGPVSFQLSGR